MKNEMHFLIINGCLMRSHNVISNIQGLQFFLKKQG